LDQANCLLCASQIEASTSTPWATPQATPWAFELLKTGLFKFPPLGAKKPFKCPPISTEITLLKDKFRRQSNTVHSYQREICHNDIFKLVVKTLLRDLFTNKSKTLSWESLKPCKAQKNPWANNSRTRGKSGSNSPPFQGNIQIPPSPGMMHNQMPGGRPGGGGGDVEASI